MTQVTGIELVVEGRTFIQEPPTFEQEMFVLQRVMESGFDKPDLLTDGASDLTRAAKMMIVHAYKSGTLFDLLGSLVTEKGTEWSPEQARANGEIFKKTRDPKAKEQLHPALITAVTAFLVSASSSEMTFPISSDETGVSVRPKDQSALTETEADQLFSSGNTALLSEKSRFDQKVERPRKSSKSWKVREGLIYFERILKKEAWACSIFRDRS